MSNTFQLGKEMNYEKISGFPIVIVALYDNIYNV